MQCHDDVIVKLIRAAAEKLADVILALKTTQDGDFHLEHLLGLLGRFELESDILLGDQIDGLVDLTEAAAAYFAILEAAGR